MSMSATIHQLVLSLRPVLMQEAPINALVRSVQLTINGRTESEYYKIGFRPWWVNEKIYFPLKVIPPLDS